MVFTYTDHLRKIIQFLEAEVAANSNIPATSIRVKRFVRYFRDWSMQINVWPIQKIDLLTPSWGSLCHNVNLLSTLIGLKTESTDMEKV